MDALELGERWRAMDTAKPRGFSYIPSLLSDAMTVALPSCMLMFMTMSSPPGMRLSGSGASPLRKTSPTLPPSVSA
jgi:hypothetical protein